MAKQLPKSDPAWGGHKTGSLYWCSIPPDQDAYPVWLATAPGSPPPPNPRVLAQQAIRVMDLRAVRIGIVPEPRPDRIGVIGLPTWMWVTDPDQHTWGPITRTASAGGYTVTATATGAAGGVGDG